MASSPHVDFRLNVITARQHSVITHAQARAAGLTTRQIDRRRSSGAWVRMTRGVYRVAGSPDTWQQHAVTAQLAVAAIGGVASHATAAALHGLGAPSPLPHVTVPPGTSARCPIAKVHRAGVDPIDRATVDGIRTTSTSRTLIDLAAVLDRPALEEAVDVSLCRGLASVGSVHAALARVGGHRPGRVLLRDVLGIWTETIDPGSPAEVRLLRAIDGWGLPVPQTQVEVRLGDGTFVARVDVAWPDHLVALEYEGREFHAARRFASDEARYAQLRRLGWRVLPVTKVDLLPGEHRLPDLLRSWLFPRAA